MTSLSIKEEMDGEHLCLSGRENTTQIFLFFVGSRWGYGYWEDRGGVRLG
jgi:hypothetical protein